MTPRDRKNPPKNLKTSSFSIWVYFGSMTPPALHIIFPSEIIQWLAHNTSLAQIFCSTRRLVEDFLLDVQQKFSTRRLVAEKQLPTRRFLEGVNIYQKSSSRKIALPDVQQNFYLDAQQNFYQMSSRPDDLGHCLHPRRNTLFLLASVSSNLEGLWPNSTLLQPPQGQDGHQILIQQGNFGTIFVYFLQGASARRPFGSLSKITIRMPEHYFYQPASMIISRLLLTTYNYAESAILPTYLIIGPFFPTKLIAR